MKTYQKIHNIFKFDEKYRKILGLNDPYEILKNLTWEGTEKVDGTNVRVCWDGYEISLAGRTEKSTFPNHLEKYLTDLFLTKEMEYVFEQMFGNKETILFGEGYGPKIQAGGNLYAESPQFILFDACVDGIALTRESVNEIAEKIGLRSVPVVFKGTLQKAVEFVSKHPTSTINEAHEMEGLVLQPIGIRLFNEEGEAIKCKCKYRDVLKLIKE